MGAALDPRHDKSADSAPKPEFVDYIETTIEQGYVQAGITVCGAVVGLLLFILAALFGAPGLGVVVAAVVIFVALAVGLFFGFDVNYRVRRMRERAAEREALAVSRRHKS